MMRCSDCGREGPVRFVQTGRSTFDEAGPAGWTIDGGRFENAVCQTGDYLCRACFDERYPIASWDAPAAGYDPAGPEWLPDDVREALARQP